MNTATTSVDRFSRLTLVRRILHSSPVVLIFATIMLFYAACVAIYYQKFFGTYDKTSLQAMAFLDAYNLVVFFIVPLLACYALFGEPASAVGLRAPVDSRQAIRLMLLAYIVVVPITLYCTQQAQFKSYYAVHNMGVGYFIFIQLLMLPLFYFSEEFFFRGFLFLTLWRKIGWHSFWITDIFFTLAHLGKPGYEIMLSIPASVLLNYLTLKTKSIYPALFVHSTIGIVMNTAVNYL